MSSEPTYCRFHLKEISLFCEDCLDGICWKCYNNHRLHRIQSLQYVFPKYQSIAINEILPNIQKSQQDLENVHHSWDCSLKSVEKNSENMKKKLSSLVNSVIQALKKKEKTLLDVLKNSTSQEILKCEKEMNQVNTLQNKLEDLKLDAYSIAYSGKAASVLQYKELLEKVKSFEEQKNSCLCRKTKDFSYTIINVEQLMTAIDEIDFKQERKEKDKKSSHTKSHKGNNNKENKSTVNSSRKRKLEEVDNVKDDSSKTKTAKIDNFDNSEGVNSTLSNKLVKNQKDAKNVKKQKSRSSDKKRHKSNDKLKAKINKSQPKYSAPGVKVSMDNVQEVLSLGSKPSNDNFVHRHQPSTVSYKDFYNFGFASQRSTVSYDDFDMFSENFGNAEFLSKEKSFSFGNILDKHMPCFNSLNDRTLYIGSTPRTNQTSCPQLKESFNIPCSTDDKLEKNPSSMNISKDAESLPSQTCKTVLDTNLKKSSTIKTNATSVNEEVIKKKPELNVKLTEPVIRSQSRITNEEKPAQIGQVHVKLEPVDDYFDRCEKILTDVKIKIEPNNKDNPSSADKEAMLENTIRFDEKSGNNIITSNSSIREENLHTAHQRLMANAVITKRQERNETEQDCDSSSDFEFDKITRAKMAVRFKDDDENEADEDNNGPKFDLNLIVTVNNDYHRNTTDFNSWETAVEGIKNAVTQTEKIPTRTVGIQKGGGNIEKPVLNSTSNFAQKCHLANKKHHLPTTNVEAKPADVGPIQTIKTIVSALSPISIKEQMTSLRPNHLITTEPVVQLLNVKVKQDDLQPDLPTEANQIKPRINVHRDKTKTKEPEQKRAVIPVELRYASQATINPSSQLVSNNGNQLLSASTVQPQTGCTGQSGYTNQPLSTSIVQLQASNTSPSCNNNRLLAKSTVQPQAGNTSQSSNNNQPLAKSTVQPQAGNTCQSSNNNQPLTKRTVQPEVGNTSQSSNNNQPLVKSTVQPQAGNTSQSSNNNQILAKSTVQQQAGNTSQSSNNNQPLAKSTVHPQAGNTCQSSNNNQPLAKSAVQPQAGYTCQSSYTNQPLDKSAVQPQTGYLGHSSYTNQPMTNHTSISSSISQLQASYLGQGQTTYISQQQSSQNTLQQAQPPAAYATHPAYYYNTDPHHNYATQPYYGYTAQPQYQFTTQSSTANMNFIMPAMLPYHTSFPWGYSSERPISGYTQPSSKYIGYINTSSRQFSVVVDTVQTDPSIYHVSQNSVTVPKASPEMSSKSSVEKTDSKELSDTFRNLPVAKENKNLLEDYKKSKLPNLCLEDVTNHVVEFSKDPEGSRFLKEKIINATTVERSCILNEILTANEVVTLSKDAFGCEVIEKLLTYSPDMQKKVLVEQLLDQVVPLCLHLNGSKVILAILSTATQDLQLDILNELDGHILKCAMDENGCKVIEKSIETVAPQHLESILDALINKISQLAVHPHGCCVVKKILRNVARKTEVIYCKILECLGILLQDEHGSTVIKSLLECRSSASLDKTKIINWLKKDVLGYSVNKFSSTVIEKCLFCLQHDHKAVLIKQVCLMNDRSFHSMLTDCFATSVLMKMLEVAKPHQRRILVLKIQSHIPTLRDSSWWKEVLEQYTSKP